MRPKPNTKTKTMWGASPKAKAKPQKRRSRTKVDSKPPKVSKQRKGVSKGGSSPKTRRKSAAQGKPPLRERNKWLWFLKWGAIGGLAMCAIMFVVLALLIWVWGRDLPNVNSRDSVHLKQVVHVQDRDGKLVAEVFEERRTVIPLKEMGELVPAAFIAAEDADFHSHEGIDYWGVFRAALVNLKSGSKKQGASTITMQVAKRRFLTPEKSVKRKVKQMLIARRIEDKWSKEDILEFYLNEIYLGHARYGVHEAALFYFGKPPAQLNPGEAAMLAGLVQAPERISPKKRRNAERAKRRQVYVLKQMAARGVIDSDEAQKWAKRPIEIVKSPAPYVGEAPEWVQIVKDHINQTAGDQDVMTLGGSVETTVDVKAQRVARAALEKGLRAVDEANNYGRTIRHVKESRRKKQLARLKRKNKNKKDGQIAYALVTKLDDKNKNAVVDLGVTLARLPLPTKKSRFNPGGLLPSKRFKVGDLIRVQLYGPDVKEQEEDEDDEQDEDDTTDSESSETATEQDKLRQVRLGPGPQGAVVVLDLKTREVIAMVGGYNFRAAAFNRAMMAKRQAGSTFKPFVYAAALETEEYTAGSIVLDAPEVYEQVDDLWKPQNYKKGTYEGPVRLRHALAKSINTVSIRVTQDIGPGRVVDMAKNLGIAGDLPETASIGLGSGAVTLIEMTNAFASLAAGGLYQEPIFIRKVMDAPLQPTEPRQVVRPEVAFIVSSMMQSVVDYGTGARAGRLKLNAAGKTGTSNRGRDAWFIGVTGTHAIGIWVGFDDDRPIGRKGTGGGAAVPVFMEIAKGIGSRRLQLQKPANVLGLTIDKSSGKLAYPGAPADTSMQEYFISGSEPTEVALDPTLIDPSTYHQSAYDEPVDEAADGGSSSSAPAMDMDDYENTDTATP